MVLGIPTKNGSRLFYKLDLIASIINKKHLSFSVAVLASIFGVGVSLFSTNKLLIASSTRSVLTQSK